MLVFNEIALLSFLTVFTPKIGAILIFYIMLQCK
jgi:hypothetical protein